MKMITVTAAWLLSLQRYYYYYGIITSSTALLLVLLHYYKQWQRVYSDDWQMNSEFWQMDIW
jgi:hypothetical protein